MLTPRKIEIECTLSPIIVAKKKKKREENVFNRTGGVRLNFPPYFLFSLFFPREIYPYIFNFTDIEKMNIDD